MPKYKEHLLVVGYVESNGEDIAVLSVGELTGETLTTTSIFLGVHAEAVYNVLIQQTVTPMKELASSFTGEQAQSLYNTLMKK